MAAEPGTGCCAPPAPLPEQDAIRLAPVFKALGDPARLRLLSLIAAHPDGEVCVCELGEVFALSGPTISHHLKVLREAGLITGARRGTWIYYRAEAELLARLAVLLDEELPGRAGAVAAPARAGR